MAGQNVIEHQFLTEEADGLPFMFSFSQEVDGVGIRGTAGNETEFWTHPYECTDTD